MDGLFKYIGNHDWFARALSYWGHLETACFGAHAEEKNSMSSVITASTPIKDHAQIRFCTLWFLQKAGLCYAQPLHNGIFTACEYSFETNPYEIYLSIKDLEILTKLSLSQILHLCTQKSV